MPFEDLPEGKTQHCPVCEFNSWTPEAIREIESKMMSVKENTKVTKFEQLWAGEVLRIINRHREGK